MRLLPLLAAALLLPATAAAQPTRFEEFVKSTTSPRSDATFTYGRPTKGHSWHAWTWAEFVRHVAETMKR